MKKEQTEDSKRFMSIRTGLKNAYDKSKDITTNVASEAINKLKPFFVRILQPPLKWLQIRWRVIRPARVSLIVSIALSLLIIGHEQIKDILRVIAENRLYDPSNWQLCLGLFIYCFCAWYFSRAVLYVCYNSFTPENSDEQFEGWRKITARLISLLPVVALITAFIGISAWLYAIFYFLFAILLLSFFIWRRKYLLPRLYSHQNHEEINYTRTPLYPGGEGFTRRTRPFIILISVFAFIVFLGVLFKPVSFPTRVGPLGVMFMGVAYLLVIFTIFTYWSDYYDLPSFIFIVLLLAVFAGLYNDNHEVRTLSGDLDQGKRQAIVKHFENWITPRIKSNNSKNKYPVFVVAAEGGGIRAAYWTAEMLIELQKRFPDFPCNTFAISGVSGGSLGASAFITDLANAYRTKQFRCIESGESHIEKIKGTNKNGPIESTSQGFLGEDFLAPVAAGLLFPDLVSRVNILCPWLICLPDRASYLEKAWEVNWTKYNEGKPLQFSDNFLDLWKEDGELEIPSLILNGTWVEDGRRTLTSNLKPNAEIFVEADDMLNNFTKRISLSTAVHMSARFTYVSPAGTVNTKSDGKKRVVDGGYFENSGALTARQVLEVLQDTCTNSEILNSSKCKDKVNFYAIIISNNPQSPHAGEGVRLANIFPNRQQYHRQELKIKENQTDENDKNSFGKNLFKKMKINFLTETLSPVFALLHTRTARGSLSEDELVASIGESHSLRFQLLDPSEDHKIPLGWILSKNTQVKINEQAALRVDEYEEKLQAIGLHKINRP